MHYTKNKEYFSYIPVVSIMVGGNKAVPERNPWPSAGCRQTFPIPDRRGSQCWAFAGQSIRCTKCCQVSYNSLESYVQLREQS